MEFAPGFLEKLEDIKKEDPVAGAALMELLANMRQAHAAWQEGKYDTFKDAMFAVSGKNPEVINEEEDLA